MNLFLKVTQPIEFGESVSPRPMLHVTQANLPPTDDVGVELVIPNVKQSEWDVFFSGLPHSSQLIDTCTLPAMARVRVADETDALNIWNNIKHWFDGIPVRVQMHEHNADSPCELKDLMVE